MDATFKQELTDSFVLWFHCKPVSWYQFQLELSILQQSLTHVASNKMCYSLTLTLVALLLHSPSFKVQDPACVLWLLCGQLFTDLLNILCMDVVKDTWTKPFTLWLIQYWGHRIWYVNDTASVTSHNKKEAVCSLQYQMLQLLVC